MIVASYTDTGAVIFSRIVWMPFPRGSVLSRIWLLVRPPRWRMGPAVGSER
jgi:hypothetical protein